MKAKHIKNIIFDLGGVILDIDYHLTRDAFIELGIKNFDELYSQKKQDHLFDNFETGNISEDQFYNEIKKASGIDLTNKEIEGAWNALLQTIPQKRILWLDDLKKEYRIFLLSNTNAIHIRAFTKYLHDSYGDDMLKEHFEKTYYSSEMGMRKPNADIFEHVLSDNKLKMEETIFIDDSVQHVEGALAMGLKGILLNKGEKVESVLEQHLS
ncbi:MAG: HAD family phosphatase [Bacteroidia bacterium]|nr:HAD family phosphatase [Bacteroidia bacterium]